MKIIAHTETGVLAQLDREEFGAIALRETYSSVKARHGIGPDDYTSHLPEGAKPMTGDMALKATEDSWRPPAGTEFFLRFDLSDAISNLRYNLAQLERFHVLTRGQKPEPEPVHFLEALAATFGAKQLDAAIGDAALHGTGIVQLVFNDAGTESATLNFSLQHIPYTSAIAPKDKPDPAGRPSPAPVSRKEVNARLRLKHPLKGLKNTDPDLYRAVKSALSKRAAASRRRQ